MPRNKGAGGHREQLDRIIERAKKELGVVW